MRRNALRRLLVLSLILLLLVPHACDNKNDERDTDRDKHQDTPAVTKGFGMSPQGFPSDWSKLGDFYSEVGDMKDGGIMWNG